MTMHSIKGGEVSYGRTVKTGDFENKRVDVTLAFSVEDGEDYDKVILYVAKEAFLRAHDMLGIKVKDTTTTQSTTQTVEKITKQEPEHKEQIKSKADIEKEVMGSLVKAEAPTKTKIAKKETVTKVEKKELEVDGEDLGDAFDEDAEESKPEVTDMVLSTMMNRKLAKLREAHGDAAPKLIKELINTFVAPPKKSHDIPQNLRNKFLEQLEKLA